MNIHNRQSNEQVFFSLEFVNILLQIEVNAAKKASSLLQFSGHSELENGLFKVRVDCDVIFNQFDPNYNTARIVGLQYCGKVILGRVAFEHKYEANTGVV